MKLSKKSLCTQVDSLRPYKSRSQRPCDFCRRRKTCCIIEKSIPCTSCIQFNHGDCTFKEGPVKRVGRKSIGSATSIKKRTVKKSSSRPLQPPPSSHQPQLLYRPSSQASPLAPNLNSPFAPPNQQLELHDYPSASSSASPNSYRYFADQSTDVHSSPHLQFDHQFEIPQSHQHQYHLHQQQQQQSNDQQLHFQHLPLLQFSQSNDRIKVERQESSSSIDTNSSIFDDVSCSTFLSPSFIPLKATDYFGNYQSHELFMGQPEKKLLQFDLFPHHCQPLQTPQHQQFDYGEVDIKIEIDQVIHHHNLDLLDALRFGLNDELI